MQADFPARCPGPLAPAKSTAARLCPLAVKGMAACVPRIGTRRHVLVRARPCLAASPSFRDKRGSADGDVRRLWGPVAEAQDAENSVAPSAALLAKGRWRQTPFGTCPFLVIDPTDLGATIVVAQALCLS